MESNVIFALCVAGGLFLPGGIPGIGLLLFPYKFIDVSLKLYDKFSLLGFGKSDLPIDPYSRFTVIYYRVLGLLLILISIIPISLIFYGCVLHECTFK
jgi:hypothetical protein